MKRLCSFVAPCPPGAPPHSVRRRVAPRGASRSHRGLPVMLCAAGLLLLDAIIPDTAAACAVCFGAAQEEAVQGLQAGILLLLGMVALVFAGFGAFLLAARRRLRRLAINSPEAT
ncbi:MAG: hypothetical protein OXP69_15705 [Spirochaetaceae bacterium]|nr:hypothetical protein [Spirochaetaceae bacterium]